MVLCVRLFNSVSQGPLIKTSHIIRTLRVLNDPRRVALHHGNGRISGAQVDADDLALDLVAIALYVFRIASSIL